MPNAATHQLGAAIAIGATMLKFEATTGKRTLKPAGGAALAAVFTNMPDWIEPAIHPHHRQFFHSLAFATLIVGGMARLYNWKPESDEAKFAKGVMLIAGGAYLIHLAMDACTRRSLPLVGRI